MSDVDRNKSETDKDLKIDNEKGIELIYQKKKNWFLTEFRGKGFFTRKIHLSVKNKEKITVEKPLVDYIQDDFDPEIEKQAIDSIEPQELNEFSHHISSRIRSAVAFNPMTTCPVLKKLANDQSDEVRFSVVRNTSTSEKILQILLNDPIEKIKKRALARCTNTSIEVLEQLANDYDVDIRRKVALNSATPIDILEILAKDSDKPVSTAAQYKIKKIKNKGHLLV